MTSNDKSFIPNFKKKKKYIYFVQKCPWSQRPAICLLNCRLKVWVDLTLSSQAKFHENRFAGLQAIRERGVEGTVDFLQAKAKST